MSLEKNALILIIEDNPQDLELIIQTLKGTNKDWCFQTCINEKDLRLLLADKKPDLILSDYNLPSFSCEEALEISRVSIPDIPFIVISGFIGEEEAVKLIVETKINDYVSKDNIKRLAPSVIRELKNYQVRKDLRKTEIEQKRSLKLLSAINDITTSLLDVESITEISNIITDKVMSHFDFKDCVIYEFDREKELLTQIAATGPKKTSPGIINAKILELGEGIVGSVAESKKAEIVNDVLQDERYIKDNEENRSEIAVPILLNGELLGVLDSEHKDKDFYTELHLQDLQTVAGVIATKFKATQESEESRKTALQLKQITNNIDAAVFRYVLKPSGEGALTYISPKAFDIFEITPEEGLKNDDLIWSQILEKDKNNVDKVFEEANKNQSNYTLEYQIKTPSGKIKWIESNGTITYADNGDVISDTISKDITDNKKIELALIKSEEKLKAITDNIEGLVQRFELYEDGSSKVTFISKGVEEIHGLTQEQVLNDTSLLWEQIHEDDLEAVQKSIEKSALEMSPWDEHWRIYHPDGVIKWLRGSGIPKKEPDTNSIIWDTVVLDVTAKKVSKQKLVEANDRLLEAQELAKIGDWSIDLITGETYISPTIKKIYGVDRELTMDEGFSYYKEGYSREKLIALINETIENGTPFTAELELITAKGKERWVRAQGKGTFKNETCVRLNGTLMDITDQKKLELELIDNEQKLKAITDNIEGLVQRYVQHEDGSNEITFISKGVEKLYQVTQEEVLKDSSVLWNQALPEELDELIKSVNKSMRELTLWDHKWRIRTPDGSIKWIKGASQPRKLPNSNSVVWDGIILDITKEVHIQKSLEETNERLLEAQELTKIGDWSIDMNTRETYVSSTVKSIYEVDHDFIMEEGIKFYKEGDNRDRIISAVNEAIENGTPYTEELELITAKGNHRWVRAQGKATFENGKCVRLNGTLMDITEEKELKLNLEKNEHRLTAAIEGANLGVFDADVKEGTNIVNSQWLTMLGYVPNEIDDTYALFFSSVHPDDIDIISNAIASLQENKKDRFEVYIRVKTKSGDYKTVLDKAKAVEFDPDGSARRIIGTHLDVTEKLELQKELQEKEQRLSAAVEGAELGVWDFDFETYNNYVNDKYLEILGYTRSEVELNMDWFNKIIHPDDLHLIDEELVRITEGGENEIDIKIRMKAKDGSYKILRDKGRIVEFGENRSIKRLVGTILDITETVELQNTLQKSLDEKVVLLSEIHHRVKNNLAIITGLINLQSMDSDDKTLKTLLGDTALRIKSIANVHELLYNNDSFSDISFDKYLKNLLDSIQQTIDDKTGTINIDIKNDLTVNINQAVPMGLLLNELITNSFKYAFDSDKENNQINFSLSFNEGYYQGSYSDSGKGFDKGDFNKSSSLGALLINTLLEQLDAEYNIETENGFTVTFKFLPIELGAHSNI